MHDRSSSHTLTVVPEFLRVAVDSGQQTRVSIDLIGTEPARLLAVETECPCVRGAATLPVDLPAGRSRIELLVTGVLPGPKALTLRTTAGSVGVTVQVVTPGFGEGAAIAAAVVAHARGNQLRIVAVVHDLRGETRNCGCSVGSLGGLDHLAALGQALPGARLVATGQIEGITPGVGTILAAHGWELHPPDIAVSSEPLAQLDQPGVLAVIDTGTASISNQRVMRPVLDRGALVTLLLISERGAVVEQHLLPIDRTLPVATDLGSVPGASSTVVLDRAANPSTTCLACHQTAHASWLVTAHARALNSLAVADQTSACATCHTTALPGRAERAPHVGCTACHQDAEAHAATPSLKTTGSTNCRECHDAKHHPAFDEVSAWLRIQHGRER